MRPLIFLMLLLGVPLGAIVASDIDPKHWPKTSSYLAGLSVIGERFRSPDHVAMRAHIVSKLSDAQLLDLRRRSIETFEDRRKQTTEEGRRSGENGISVRPPVNRIPQTNCAAKRHAANPYRLALKA